MTKSLVIDGPNSRIRLNNGSRVVSTTEGTLVNVLPTVNSFGPISVVYPDFTKGNFIKQEWEQISDPFVSFPAQRIAEIGRSYVSVTPQEYDVATDLMDVPAGSDYFDGNIVLSRTGAPSDASIACIPIQNEEISFVGGCVVTLEQVPGFTRLFHLYTQSGKLKWAKQQSTAPAMGNVSSWSGSAGGGYLKGGNNSFSVAGFVSYGPVATTTANYVSGFGSSENRCARGGSNAPSTGDPTNYQSTYSISLEVRFGRRS